MININASSLAIVKKSCTMVANRTDIQLIAVNNTKMMIIIDISNVLTN
jgi:hypothetical protein